MRASTCGMLVATLVVYGCTRQQPLGPAAEAQGVQAIAADAETELQSRREDMNRLRREWPERNDIAAEIERVRSDSPLERARGAARLAEMAGPGERRDISAAVSDLILLLADDSPLLSTDVHPFRSALASTTPGHEAARALGYARPAPVEPLRAVLQKPPSDLAMAQAIAAAGSGGMQPLAGEVEGALAHPSAEVRLAAYRAMKPVAPDRGGGLLAACVPGEQELLAPLLVVLARAAPEEGMAALEQVMGDVSPSRRREAAQAIGDLGSSTQAPEFRDRFFPRLARAITAEPSAEVRERQAWALSRAREHADLAAEALLTVVRDDPVPEVRASAASTLGSLETPAGSRAEVLLAALDDDRQVQNRAVQALNRMVRDGEITPEAMPDLVPRLRERLMTALRNQEDVVSRWAGNILTRIPEPGTVDELFGLLTERKCVYEVGVALIGLAKEDPRLLPALDAVVMDETAPVGARRGLAESLRWLTAGDHGRPGDAALQWWREHRAEYLNRP